MYEKELKRAERLLENEFGTEWKKIVQTLGVFQMLLTVIHLQYEDGLRK